MTFLFACVCEVSYQDVFCECVMPDISDDAQKCGWATYGEIEKACYSSFCKSSKLSTTRACAHTVLKVFMNTLSVVKAVENS